MLRRIIEAYRRDPHGWNGEILAWTLALLVAAGTFIAIDNGVTDGRLMIGVFALTVSAIGNLLKTL